MSTLLRPLARFSAFALLAVAIAPAAAESYGDRQLLATVGGDPYLFIILDTSGSMNWATACSQADRDAGLCDHDCPAPNCPQPLNGDDPNSKLYQAKAALYDVIKEAKGVRWGFATLNQDQLVVTAKHWLYEVTAIELVSGTAAPAFPAVGWQEVFGLRSGGTGAAAFNIECDRRTPGTDNSNSALYETGCYMNSQDAVATTTTSGWSVEKLKRLPKGGANGLTPTVYFLRNAASTTFYRVTYGAMAAPVDYSAADTLTVPVTIQSCPSASVNASTRCGAADTLWSAVSIRNVSYQRVAPFLYWEGSPRNSADLSQNAYFGGRTDGLAQTLTGVAHASGLWATETCRGMEPSGPYPAASSTLTEVDPFGGYNLKFPTTHRTFNPSDPAHNWVFEYGDVIPLDWDNDNHEAVLKRLNPKHPLVDDESFAVAPYFADTYQSGEAFLRLKDENQRPLVGYGSTPMAGFYSFFRAWYSGCGRPGGACASQYKGWNDYAAQFDDTFNCSGKYVLMVTDAGETCDRESPGTENYYTSNASKFPTGFLSAADDCVYRASLRALEKVNNIALGFGTENQSDLQCANTPVYFANTRGDLAASLEAIIGEILEQAASFASAAVPTVQANIADKIYLSSFIPLNEAAIWPGRLDAFLKPLPLDDDNLPDRSVLCAEGQKSACFAWDAGDSQLGWDVDGPSGGYDPKGLLLQAPIESEINREFTQGGNATLKIGSASDERRLFFGRPDDDDLGLRRYFQYPTADDEWLDLEFVWNITVNDDPLDAPLSDNRKDAIADIIEFTVKEKQALIDRVCTAGSRPGLPCTVDSECDSDPPTGPGDGICAEDARVQYLMGDIFHSNPIVLNPPADFELFTKDLYWNTPLCGQTLDQTRGRGAQISYSWYSNKNLCRRIMLAVGSNDGQLHVFDGGIIRDVQADDPTTDEDETVAADCLLPVPAQSSSRLAGLFDDDSQAGDFDNGTGREIFSFIPQAMMPLIKELSEIEELTTEYGVDNTMRIADVFIDPAPEAGVATCTERAWRTVMLGSYREGGPGIFALDITQPDAFASDNRPEPLAGTPEYVPSCIDGGAGCDDFCISGDSACAALPFPALKWEFRDLDENGNPADDDANGVTDMAESWSRPLVVRMQVCTDECDPEDIEDRWVAIFGGGVSDDPSNDASEDTGNWLYMLDIETGKILYKRGGSGAGTTSPIVGAVPADIAGVDSDVDGFVDTLYFGTTAGFLYKVALGDGPFELDEITGRILDPADAVGAYDPFQVFDTGGRPIYLEANAVYVPKLRGNAVLFGTGVRWDLWESGGSEGRFYALVDQNWSDSDRDGVIDEVCFGCPQPLNETVYIGIDPDDFVSPTANFLYGNIQSGKLPGWYFTLGTDEKLITEPFTLSGVTFFTFYDPLTFESAEGCGVGGESKIFIVNTVTTAGYAVRIGDTERSRYLIAPTFTTQPYVESSATKNEPTSSSTANADTWTTELREINADLRKLFPPGARFANYSLDIKTIRSDTGIVFIAPVPVAIEPHNWKEF